MLAALLLVCVVGACAGLAFLSEVIMPVRFIIYLAHIAMYTIILSVNCF